jgi:hypothetical protein
VKKYSFVRSREGMAITFPYTLLYRPPYRMSATSKNIVDFVGRYDYIYV